MSEAVASRTVLAQLVETLRALYSVGTRDYLHTVNRPVTHTEVQQALGLTQTPRFALNRMANRGWVQRIAPGAYTTRPRRSREPIRVGE